VTALSRSIRLPQAIRPRDLPFGRLAPLALWALVGVELAAAAALWPDTLGDWWRAERRGDFDMFFTSARGLEPNGLYAPAVSLLLRPLTVLSVTGAYRVFVALGFAAYFAVAWLGQSRVHQPEARLALALGILTMPQMHWALRYGHFTAFLALFALAGFLLLNRRPVLAGLCFAVLILKPQYAPLPALYLLWTRNWRALGACTLGALAIELAGFAAVGFDAVAPYLRNALDWGPDARDNLLPIQQAWQYAWSGFLISAGLEPNPLVVFDLLLLSFAAVAIVWLRAGRSAALAATALGMLVVTPYSNFYDWGLLAVAAALLVRTQLRGPVVAVLLGGLYGALLASQAATPWPIVDVGLEMSGTQGRFLITPGDLPSGTRGLYWVTPAALLAICALAFAARPAADRPAAAAPHAGPRARSFALAAALVPAVYLASAFLAGAPPFSHETDRYSEGAVLRELPPGFPLPAGSAVLDAGRGEQLPYHVEWMTGHPVSEVAGIYRRLIASEGWELMLDEQAEPSYRVRLSRITPGGFMTHWAMLDVSPWRAGSRISLDFIVIQRLDLAGQ
jgi:hypothetical protein